MRRVLAGLLLLLSSSGCNFLRGYAGGSSAVMPEYEAHPDRGFFRLAFEDFQGLDTDAMQKSAVPYKLVAAATVARLRAEGQDLPLTEASFTGVMKQRYGFVVPKRVANWPKDVPQREWARPLGVIYGDAKRSLPQVSFEVMNTGCSTCHAATLYDAEGLPTDEAWVGLPSTSIHLDAYAKGAFAALSYAAKKPDDVFAAMAAMFPAMTEVERDSLERFFLPKLVDMMESLEAAGLQSFTPWSNGTPGLANGVATLQYYLGLLEPTAPAPDQVAFTQIPELAGLEVRRSILADGIYAPKGWAHLGPLETGGDEAHRAGMAAVATMVTVSTLGVDIDKAPANVKVMRDVVDYAFDKYQSPPFPGPIDASLTTLGGGVFERKCSGCHGRYEKRGVRFEVVSFPNKRSSLEAIGTDPTRLQAVTDEAISALRSSAIDQLLDADRPEGYVAIPLTGVWATAPYLHNGSVPTLWHLLHPEARPTKFQVGGHRLDYARMGIAGEVGEDGVFRYPASYRPWSDPVVYDTTAKGGSNKGHEAQFAALGEEEKAAVLEFLKQL